MVIGPEISTSMFFWHPEMATFSQEVSSLGQFQPGQLYDDAADLGFVLVSDRTGDKIPFYFHKEEHHNGELVAWEFHSASKDPRLAKLKVIVHND